MATLAGVRQSFGRAEHLLSELAGWQLDEETIRRLCHTEAARATTTRNGPPRNSRRRLRSRIADRCEKSTPWRVGAMSRSACSRAGSVANRPVPRSGTNATCRRRRFGRSWLPSKKPSASALRCRGPRLNASGLVCWETEPSGSGTRPNSGPAWRAQELDIYHAAEHLGAAARRRSSARGIQRRAVAGAGDTAARGEDGYWGVVEWLGELSGQLPLECGRGFAGRRVELLRGPSRAFAVCSAGATGPVSRQWPGGRLDQTTPQSATQADGSPLEKGM